MKKEIWNLLSMLLKILVQNWMGKNNQIKKYKKIFYSKHNTPQRDEGALMPLGQKMWSRAKNIIPGGTMLFQKIQIYFYQKNGHHISKRLKIVLFGTWKIKNT